MNNFRLSDCCLSISDGDHLAPPKTDEGVPFITIRNFDTYNDIDFSETMSVPEEYYDGLKSIRKPQRGDILYSVVGSFGIPVLIKEDNKFIFQRHIAILRPNPQKVDTNYLFQLMRSESFYAVADILAIGSAQRTISLTSLRQISIELPSLEIQQKIGCVLSEYDELIVINRKKIQVLEEMAMRTYREWFVHMRFPGHETTPIKDGLPEGWKYDLLSELGSFKRGVNITIDEAIEGNVPVIAGGLTPSCYHNEANTAAPVITVSASGANAGFTNIFFEDVWAADCSYIDSECANLFFIYCFMKTYKEAIDNLQKGSAQPHVYAKDLNNMKILIPSQQVLTSFRQVVEPFFKERQKSQQKILFLQQMRDKLLPQLMSGKFKVKP